MIAAWMAYSLLVGALVAGAAWALEALLRSHRRPTRWIWAVGMALAGGWPVWTALGPDLASPAPAPAGVIPLGAVETLTLRVEETSFFHALDRPLLLGWILASSLLVAGGVFLLHRTRRLRGSWVGSRARGRDILLSEDWGPAVVGFLEPRIVLPRWCEAMGGEGLELILDHEAEHLRAGDLRLLILAGIPPVLLPWSLPLWWMWHRLRLAVEGDCDLRVLRKNPRATRAYLELLLDVGRRVPKDRHAAAMLSEPVQSLERRIKTMTMPFPKKPLLRGGLLVAVGGTLVAVACLAPSPMAVEEDLEMAPVDVPGEGALSPRAQAVAGEPTFTPFTVRPDIMNRADITRAMEENYPPLLREAGIGGTATVWFFLDETGAVRRTLINGSSGHLALDDAAVRVAEIIRFTPAENEGKPVPVWISLPITFTVGSGVEGG